MKVIFLDFDGVINNWDNFDNIDINNVLILKKIIEQTNSKVVAITSKKYSFQRNSKIDYKKTQFYNFVQELKKHGVIITDVTPYINENREKEIIEYLKNNPQIEQYLILDDEFVSETLKEHQVLPDLYNGLQLEHILPSINILNGQLGFYPIDFDYNQTPEQISIRINKYHNSKKNKMWYNIYMNKIKKVGNMNERI